ncbi:MAG: acyl-CoA thioesterase, partial [Polyangiales bacterium]
VNATFRTSLEVEVLVERETADTMERTVCADALLTFVAVDDDGKPCPVPALRIETEQERERAREAEDRRKHRLAVKHGR